LVPPEPLLLPVKSGHCEAAEVKQAIVTASQQLMAPGDAGQLAWHSLSVVHDEGQTPPPPVPVPVVPVEVPVPLLAAPVSTNVVPVSGIGKLERDPESMMTTPPPPPSADSTKPASLNSVSP